MIKSFPEGGEISGDQTGEDVQRCAALAGGVDDLFAVTGIGAREDLGEFRDQRAGDGPAADDDGKGQPGRKWNRPTVGRSPSRK